MCECIKLTNEKLAEQGLMLVTALRECHNYLAGEQNGYYDRTHLKRIVEQAGNALAAAGLTIKETT